MDLSAFILETLPPDQIKKNIVMVVGGRILGDSRVIKSATSLVEDGFNVLLVGTAPLKTKYSISEISGIRCLLCDSSEYRQALQKSKEEHISLSFAVSFRIIGLIKNAKFSVLYTHDYWGLNYGADIISYCYTKDKIFWLHDIHEYVDGYEGIVPRGRLEWAREVERKYIRLPDELIIVNEKISELISQKYDLGAVPTHILHNAPRKQIVSEFNLRNELGLEEQTPLGVYIGSAKPPRGLDIVIPALLKMPKMHIALMSSVAASYLNELKMEAAKRGVAHRFHVFDYVPDNEVCSAVESADFSISPLTRYGNTDLAIATKILESLHAGLPMVVSDAQLQKEFIEEHCLGKVHQVGDVSEFVDAVQDVLDNRDRYTASEILIRKFSWEFQFAGISESVKRFSETRKIRGRGILHGFGPSAGQPFGLASALRQKGKMSESLTVTSSSKFEISSDAVFPYRHVLNGLCLTKWVVDRFDLVHYHFRPIFNVFQNHKYQSPSFMDFVILKQSGIKIVFNFRGSEVRNNETFRELNPFAWEEQDDPAANVFLDSTRSVLVAAVRESADLILVPDPELQSYIPEAKILNRVIDINEYRNHPPANNFKPLIVHAPSRRAAKGTARVLSVVEQLREEGFVFDFELLENLSRTQVREKLESADIVIDQLLIGWYGVLSVEAMSLGKVVVAYLRDDIKDFLEGLPIVNANPNNLRLKLIELLEDPKLRCELGAQSRNFAERFHSGESVSSVLETYYDEVKATKNFSSVYPETTLNLVVQNSIDVINLRKANRKKAADVSSKNKILGVSVADSAASINSLSQGIAKRRGNIIQRFINAEIRLCLKPFLNEAKAAKLKQNPKLFFSDSRNFFVRILGKFYSMSV